MPKKSSQRGTKSAAIRELLSKNPRMKAREVVSTLAGQGMNVNPNLVYLLKSKLKGQRRRRKRQQAVVASRNAGLSNPVELVRGVKDLAVKAGGMNKLKQLVDVLAD